MNRHCCRAQISGDLDVGSESADVSRESCPASTATSAECWQVLWGNAQVVTEEFL
jgi:hypothetical protein